MNLLYLNLLIPLLSFLLLASIGHKIRTQTIIIIGISAPLIMFIVTIFVCIDYQANSVPDMTLIYTRFLWNWFSVGDFNIPFTLVLDGLSIIFLFIITFFALITYFFAAFYLNSVKDIYRFYAYSNLLLASILTIIFVDNLFVMLIGWEGVTLSTYLLIGIYYNQLRNGYAAVKTFVLMHLTDVFFIIAIFLIYQELGTLSIRSVLTLAHDNLAVDSDIIFWITLMLFLGAMSKAALFPMQTWFTETTLAPMPALGLLQTSTVVLSGIYLVLRLNELFIMSSDTLFYMMVISAFSILFTSTIALVHVDIKRIITYLNLTQISYLFLAFSTKSWSLSLNFLINYVLTSCLLIFATSILLKKCNGQRDITKLGGLVKKFPYLYMIFMIVLFSLSLFPWLSASFYIKGDIIFSLMQQGNLIAGTIALLGILLASLAMIRIIVFIFNGKAKTKSFATANKLIYTPFFILPIFVTVLFIYIPLPIPIPGILSETPLNADDLFLFQLLLASVTFLSFIIGYFIFAHPNHEIKEVFNTPIVMCFMRLSNSDWRFDYLLKLIFVRPYLYLANLVKNDPLAKWDEWIVWGIKKLNTIVINLENGHIRYYIVSIVIGSIFILMLLIFNS